MENQHDYRAGKIHFPLCFSIASNRRCHETFNCNHAKKMHLPKQKKDGKAPRKMALLRHKWKDLKSKQQYLQVFGFDSKSRFFKNSLCSYNGIWKSIFAKEKGHTFLSWNSPLGATSCKLKIQFCEMKKKLTRREISSFFREESWSSLHSWVEWNDSDKFVLKRKLQWPFINRPVA